MRDSVCLFDSDQIEGMLNRIASQINGAKVTKECPIITTVLNGGMIFAGNLIPKFKFKCQLDYIHATRYGAKQTGCEIKWIAEPTIDPKGRDIIIIDDILDEGITLDCISNYYMSRGARSVTIVVMLWKPEKSEYFPTYFGEAIADHFVYGYGLDLDGYERNLNEIRHKIKET